MCARSSRPPGRRARQHRSCHVAVGGSSGPSAPACAAFNAARYRRRRVVYAGGGNVAREGGSGNVCACSACVVVVRVALCVCACAVERCGPGADGVVVARQVEARSNTLLPASRMSTFLNTYACFTPAAVRLRHAQQILSMALLPRACVQKAWAAAGSGGFERLFLRAAWRAGVGVRYLPSSSRVVCARLRRSAGGGSGARVPRRQCYQAATLHRLSRAVGQPECRLALMFAQMPSDFAAFTARFIPPASRLLIPPSSSDHLLLLQRRSRRACSVAPHGR